MVVSTDSHCPEKDVSMSTEQTVEENELPHLPVGAHPASIRSLEKALEQLRQAATRSQFLVEVPRDPSRKKASGKLQRPTSSAPHATYVVMASKNDRLAATEREASRRYIGAKNFF
jgi:hypothetical protein